MAHVVDYLSDLEAASVVTARVASTNIASQRVMIKSGFEAVGDTSELLPDGELKVPGIVFRREI